MRITQSTLGRLYAQAKTCCCRCSHRCRRRRRHRTQLTLSHTQPYHINKNINVTNNLFFTRLALGLCLCVCLYLCVRGAKNARASIADNFAQLQRDNSPYNVQFNSIKNYKPSTHTNYFDAAQLFFSPSSSDVLLFTARKSHGNLFDVHTISECKPKDRQSGRSCAREKE